MDPTSSARIETAVSPGPAVQPAIYRRVAGRLIPLLFLCYIGAYLDRVNVGFAKLEMASKLHFSDTVFSSSSSRMTASRSVMEW